MSTLSREHRRLLENTVAQARTIAEEGARKVLRDQYAVYHHEPWPHMTAEDRQLRNQLRAHGRQLGDRRDARRETQEIDHLAQACAYEYWHRMLFARFLAENNLLIDAQYGVAMTLDEVRELAREQRRDWMDVASELAQRMLLAVFRPDDPVLKVHLPPETQQQLEEKLATLPKEIFEADDSLGWVYQFWQRDEKDRVNRSEVKIGADEIAAVTQLFTEDYMVLFLLENTLGAWWTAKRRTEGKNPALPGYQWTYLRLNEDDSPAAGSFDGWPGAARELRVLDPCMGSGHFLVFALPILARMRMEEEGLSLREALTAVLKENLYGLEIDARCSQIAAFNLALAAWRLAGDHFALPEMNLACSGLGIHASEADWLRLAGDDERARQTMRRLFDLFQQAPVLGSLIDPNRVGGTLLAAEFQAVRSLFHKALELERGNDALTELAIAAEGVIHAAHILSRRFTLVATNVPYLGRPDQCHQLRDYCDRYHALAKSDLATCLLDRCRAFSDNGGTVSTVITQSWLSQPRYKGFRKEVLRSGRLELLAKLGPRAFETISGEQVNVCLLAYSNTPPTPGHHFAGVDATTFKGPGEKRGALLAEAILKVDQRRQLENPDHRIALVSLEGERILARFASCVQGLATSDDPQFTCFFWEFPSIAQGWEGLVGTVEQTVLYGGRERLIHWEDGQGRYFRHAQALKAEGRLGGWKSGTEARGKMGVLVSQMSTMPVTIYSGEFYDHNASVLIVHQPEQLPAVWSFAGSDEFARSVRDLDQSLKPSNNVFVKVPFDLGRWQQLAAQKYPTGLPKPHSDDPSQWLFNGLPKGSDYPLQVGVARLVGYGWPRQTGSSFPECPALEPDGLERHADSDGIVPLIAIASEASAADRLRALLANAYGSDWSAAKLQELLGEWDSPEDWLREAFFEEHCRIFHQRPFVWHVWDGRKDGFHALVNYHKLAAPNGEGRKTLEKLIYTYLGRWIERQTDEIRGGKEGADARLTAATHLKAELEKILEGEKPYDIFVRWKPLHEQPVGWEPDINDGVRLNIRPWLTAKVHQPSRRDGCILRVTPRINFGKDRGKEPHRAKEDFPWFWNWDESTEDFLGGDTFDGARWNDLHYSLVTKKRARDRKRAEAAAEAGKR